MDTWVRERIPDPSQIPLGIDLRASGNNNGTLLIDMFILALLRRFHNDSRSAEIKKLIEQYTGLMGRELRAVCEYCFTQRDKPEFLENFIKTNEAGVFKLLVRSGVNIRMPVSMILETRPEKPDLWWLLQATPPDKESIVALLGMGIEERLVLGLVTPEELNSFPLDNDSQEWVHDRRRH